MLTKVSMPAIAVPRDFTIGGVNPDDTIILKSISGLTPSDLTLFTGDYAGNGGYYQGRRVGGRNVVFNFKLNPDYSVGGRSVSSLREELYSMFYQPTTYQDKLAVFLYDDEKPVRSLNVYPDKYQGDIFSQDTSVQISTQCVDPFISGPLVSYNAPAGGVISTPVSYPGTAMNGFKMTIRAVTAGTQFYVDLNGFKMHWVGTISAGDMWTISTEEGNQYITYIPSPAFIPVSGLGGLSSDSVWLELNNVNNVLKTYGNVPNDGKTVIDSYQYTSKWWGV